MPRIGGSLAGLIIAALLPACSQSSGAMTSGSGSSIAGRNPGAQGSTTTNLPAPSSPAPTEATPTTAAVPVTSATTAPVGVTASTSTSVVAATTVPGPTVAPAVTGPPATLAPLTLPAPTATGPLLWATVAESGGAPAVEMASAPTSDGAKIVLLRYAAGRTHFDLHVGSTDPPTYGRPLPPDAQSVVSAAERPVLLGAFNGGFKANTGYGGFVVDGIGLRPLVDAYAGLVIDTDGRARVAVWNRTAPAPGELIASVRQNLAPLVSDGQPSPRIGAIAEWGATLRGLQYVARSALGSDAQGNLVYAGSNSAVPADLSNALIRAGCVTAMELDINPEWVQADVASTPGGPLAAAVPAQNRPANQYLYGYSRDFVAVLAGP